MPFQTTTSPRYRSRRDSENSKAAFKAADRKVYMEIEKAADIFAICSTLFSVFTGTYAYDEDNFELLPDARSKLLESGLSQETSDLILNGLNTDYKQRPSISLLFEAFKKELSQVDFSLIKWLSEQSLH